MKYTINEEGHLVISEPRESTELVELEQRGMLEGLAKFEIGPIPVGKAVSGSVALGLTDLIKGLLNGLIPVQDPSLRDALLNLGLIWGIKTKPIARIVGPTTADAVAFVLTMDAIRPLFDIRGAIAGLFHGAQFKMRQTMKGDTQTVADNGHREIASLEEYNRVHGLV